MRPAGRVAELGSLAVMSALTEHRHQFLPDEWPFEAPSNTAAFTTARVAKEGRPILMVYHDHDGDWQFHCGFIEDGEKPSVFCLGCIYDLDPTVAAVADLPVGWMASRESVGAPWQRESYEAQDIDG